MATKRALYGVAALIMLIGMVSCAYNAGFVKSTYDMLSVSKTSYETAVETVIDLHRQGRITDEKKSELFEVGRQFATAHNAAVEALAQYEEYSFLAGQDELEKNIEIAAQALSTLLGLIKPYLLEDE